MRFSNLFVKSCVHENHIHIIHRIYAFSLNEVPNYTKAPYIQGYTATINGLVHIK